MNAISLIIYPYNKPQFSIKLIENNNMQKNMEQIIGSSREKHIIFSDLTYEFELQAESVDGIKEVRVYINDVYEPSVFKNGKISFPQKFGNDRRIFLDCYGFVELNITLIMEDETEKSFVSEYLSILVRKGQLNDSIQAMVKYVYTQPEGILINGELKARNGSDLKESKYKSLASQIILAEEIVTVYEASFGYFKANCRFHIEKVAAVDRVEKLQNLTLSTLEYISSHPEQLRTVNGKYGIRIGTRVYHPQKTLLLQNQQSYDIYENKVILGFLRKMIDEVEMLCKRCKQLLEQIPDDKEYDNEYAFSSYFMFAETRKAIENSAERLSCIYDKAIRLWKMYQNAIMIKVDPLTCEPQPTAIFMAIPQYNKIFMHIYQWFNFGVYDFAKEKYMLSFIKISSLYENYILVKMNVYFKERGYFFQGSERCTYPIHKKWKYKNTDCINTFYYSDEKSQITLYYQPVIFNTDKSSVNKIGLYRNNSIPVDAEENRGYAGAAYYVPDYLIKVEKDGIVKYLIIDAKFSDIITVKKYYVKDLVFKYLFSISPIVNTETIAGLCIIYGKCTLEERMQSVYDNQISENAITPFMDIMPLIEGENEDSQYNKLDMLIKKLLA